MTNGSGAYSGRELCTEEVTKVCNKKKKKGVIRKDWEKNKLMYLMVLPVLIYYIIFCYLPMSGLLIAFQDYKQVLGNTFFENILSSQWVGFKHFTDFFKNVHFTQTLWNTARISFLSILFGFPAPIILALLINEVTHSGIKRTVQTVTYLPHFVSLVVICGMIRTFTNDTGMISHIWAAITGNEPVNMLLRADMFIPIYIVSNIWQGIGWGSIIYLSALSGISQELYEAATVDGANRWKQTLHVTLPGLMPTISIMLILRLGSVLNVGYEKIILLYNDLTKPVAEVISTYVYQKGLIDRNYSFSTAVGLFNSVINVIFLIATNAISRKMGETSLW